MYIVMLGPPGCGKGTQTEFLQKEYGIPTISTGDLFRYNIKNNTELGMLALSYINKGQLVPDDVTTRMLEERIGKSDCSNGYILDGYPRNLNQADELGRICPGLDLVLNIYVPDEVIIERLSSRVIGSDKKTYNLVTNPPPKEMEYTRRDDDKPETVKNRLEVYHKETKPLIEYYSNKGIMQMIDGILPVQDVTNRLKDIIEQNLTNQR